MKRRTKVWLLAAGALILAGCVVLAGVLWTQKWNFKALSTVEYETNVYEIGEAFYDLDVTTDAAAVVLARSADGACRVECREAKNARHTVDVADGTLVIGTEAQSGWSYLGAEFESPVVTVYLPEAAYGALTVHVGAGNVRVPDGFVFASADIRVGAGDAEFGADAAGAVRLETGTGTILVQGAAAETLEATVSAGSVTVEDTVCRGDVTVGVSTGKAVLRAVTGRNVVSTGSTGSIRLEDVVAEERMEIGRSTGDVEFDGCDAGEISVETSTGDVSGSLRSGKVFFAESSTGKVDVPRTTDGGVCEIRSGTGDIEIRIQ